MNRTFDFSTPYLSVRRKLDGWFHGGAAGRSERLAGKTVVTSNISYHFYLRRYSYGARKAAEPKILPLRKLKRRCFSFIHRICVHVQSYGGGPHVKLLCREHIEHESCHVDRFSGILQIFACNCSIFASILAEPVLAR